MGGACPSRAPPPPPVGAPRAPPHPPVETSRAPPPPLVGGWYRNGSSWVHVEIKVVINDGIDNGLRGEGTMSAADVMYVRFKHRPELVVRGDIQLDGNISWGNKRTWERDACGTQQWVAPTTSPASSSGTGSLSTDSDANPREQPPLRRFPAWLRTIHTSGHGLPKRVPATHFGGCLSPQPESPPRPPRAAPPLPPQPEAPGQARGPNLLPHHLERKQQTCPNCGRVAGELKWLPHPGGRDGESWHVRVVDGSGHMGTHARAL